MASPFPSSKVKGFWECEEAATPFVDSSGNGNSLVISGVSLQQTGMFDFCGLCDGINDFAGIADASQTGLDMGLVSFAVVHWYKTDNSTTGLTHISKWENAAPGALGWHVDQGNPVAANVDQFTLQDGTLSVTANGTTPTSIGSLRCVIGVCDRVGGNAKIYVNGVLEGTTALGLLGSVDTVGDFEIGRLATLGVQYYNGRIDRILVIRDQVIEQSDVNWIYNSGSGRSWSDFTSLFKGGSNLAIGVI